MKSILIGLILLLLSVANANALLIDLIYEFDGNSNDGLTSFGTVDITESSGDLDFTITANTTNLGSINADIHEIYFNLTFDATNLEISDFSPIALNPPESSLEIPPTIAGSAGSGFDYGINFGDGEPQYSQLSFTLSALENLTIANLLEWSTTNNTPPVLMAVHFQSTNVFGETSETVGGGVAPVPEPATMLLFGTGLACLAGLARRKKK